MKKGSQKLFGRDAPPSGGIATIQALRASACLLVVAYHAVESWAVHQAPDSAWPNGATGVDLFFVISGFVMALSAAAPTGLAGAVRFGRRRLARIVPLYWIMTAAKLAILLLLGAPLAFPAASHIVASLLFIPWRDTAGVVRPVLGVGWTLEFEMLFYMLFAVGLAIGRPGLRLALPILPLAVAGFLRRPDWPAPFVLANGLVLEFCLGLAVANWHTAGGRLSPWTAACALAIGAGLLMGVPPCGGWRFLAWGVPAALILAASVSLEPVCGRHVPAWLLALGEASYAIYLVHPFLVPAVAQTAQRLGLGGWPVLVGASLVLSAFGGAAVDRWVDRPVQRRLRGNRRVATARTLDGSAETVSHLVQL